MACVTLTTDFGYKDHYVAMVKAVVLAANPLTPIVDITHEIDKYNVAQASYVLASAFKDFPLGSVHIVGVNTLEKIEGYSPFIAVEIEGHFFVAPNNGILALIAEAPNLTGCAIEVPKETIFPTKDVLAPAASLLWENQSLDTLQQEQVEMCRMLNRSARITEDSIMGSVIYIDSFGNCVTNIKHQSIERIRSGRNFEIRFGREIIRAISSDYGSIDTAGDCVVVINSRGLLEIAQNKGSANKLIGLRYGTPVTIDFI